MAKLEEYFSAERIRTVTAGAQRAIGRPFKVRHTDKLATHGVITAVRPAYASFSPSGKTVYMVFSIDMECGTKKVPHTFNIRGKDLPVA